MSLQCHSCPSSAWLPDVSPDGSAPPSLTARSSAHQPQPLRPPHRFSFCSAKGDNVELVDVHRARGSADTCHGTEHIGGITAAVFYSAKPSETQGRTAGVSLVKITGSQGIGCRQTPGMDRRSKCIQPLNCTQLVEIPAAPQVLHTFFFP